MKVDFHYIDDKREVKVQIVEPLPACTGSGDAAYDSEVKLALGFERDDQIVSFLYLGTPVTAGTPHASDPQEHVRWAAAEA